ncbi:LacI family DNA-binding transcriptional regulator [Virgibacillus necropolis]|uniref:LacI family DNA-binding transcriptional regulator n=1 Tax=Virgibacillus necropolis TaxID=163877 RepID=UPI0013747252|nr:LacI family DNA-binding transcriptional regulator [Virgibacillus necropolis]
MVSSKDVAKLSGFSQATVSRVMNSPDKVNSKTKKKILKTMEQLNYQPNLIARSLITNRTKTIALISGELHNAFFVETTDSIVNLASKYGYKTMVYFDNGNNAKEIYNSVVGAKVDGILMSSIMLDDPLLEEIENSGIPYMFFNRRPRRGGNYVVSNNKLAGELITKHLIGLNHNRIAYISGELNISTFLERKQGFEQALKKGNIEIDSSLQCITDASTSEVEKKTLKLINYSNPPSAIVYATDAMALVGMNAILSMGLNIPDDISIAGIDNNSISSHYAIQLTSVGNPGFKMEELAMEILIEVMTNKNITRRQIIPNPEVIIRRTTSVKN